MRNTNGERGFSLIGILISAVIVMILVMMSLQTYGPVLQGAGGGGGGGGATNALGMNMAKTRVRQLFTAEQTYHTLHRSYATWEQLVSDGQIPRGYVREVQGRGTPFVPGHDVEIELTDSGFVITATPDPDAARKTPILKIDQSGQLEEVPQE